MNGKRANRLMRLEVAKSLSSSSRMEEVDSKKRRLNRTRVDELVNEPCKCGDLTEQFYAHYVITVISHHFTKPMAIK
jgi:hypothetical protein